MNKIGYKVFYIKFDKFTQKQADTLETVTNERMERMKRECDLTGHRLEITGLSITKAECGTPIIQAITYELVKNEKI